VDVFIRSSSRALYGVYFNGLVNVVFPLTVPLENFLNPPMYSECTYIDCFCNYFLQDVAPFFIEIIGSKL
jgi:hypothetical protein